MSKDEASIGAVQIMLTIKMKIEIRNILKSNIKDIIFYSKRVKAVIFWVKEKIKFMKKQKRQKTSKNLTSIIFHFLLF